MYVILIAKTMLDYPGGEDRDDDDELISIFAVNGEVLGSCKMNKVNNGKSANKVYVGLVSGGK